MRRTVFILPLAVLVCLASPAGARPSGERSYRIHVLPDPSGDVPTYGHCGALDAYAAGYHVGGHTIALRVPAGSTLRASLVAQANVFAGDVGLGWSLRIHDTQWRELGRSRGPAWRTTVTRSFATAQQVWLLA